MLGRDLRRGRRRNKAINVIEFDRLAEALPQIVWITDPDGRNIYFNQQWEDYTGLTVEEGRGHGWNIPFHPDDRTRAWEAWQHAWQTDGVYSLECRLRRKDGIYRWWLIRGNALHDTDGKIVNWYGTWTDVEDIKQTEQKLRQAYDEIRQLYEKTTSLNQLKTQMFANVSHELRTPLTLILAPIEHLLSMRLPEEATARLELAHRNAHGLLKQINDLLDVARIEAARTTVEYSQADLALWTRHIASSFEHLAKDKDIRFSVSTGPSMPAEIDVAKFERILVNLLSNAFKFTPIGGAIECTLSRSDDGHACVEVRDSGPGIPASYRSSIFEQFFQIPGSARFGGTGLGLSIVKEFVEIQNGSISVGEAPEGGGLFSIEIPTRAPSGTVVNAPVADITAGHSDTQARRSLLSASHQPDGSNQHVVEYRARRQGMPRVLVVEDNPDMRAYLCEALGGEFDIVTATNGLEGFERARLMRPALIVSDVMMPEMDGDEMFRRLRASEECKTTPVVLLTAKADDSLRMSLLDAGAIDYITKPFSTQELRAKAANLLQLKKNEAEYRALFETARVDVGVVVKASQAVSQEIEYAKLVETLLSIAVEHAGADRGLLVMKRESTLQIEAEARIVGRCVDVTLRTTPIADSGLTTHVLERAIQTSEPVLFDASFPSDLGEHMGARSIGSVLCLPLVKQAKPIGAMYFENQSTRGAFTPERIAVLVAVTSQAAISLENALLFANLQRENSERKRVEQVLLVREARIRRLGDSNVIGMFFADTNGRITEANDAFLNMTGYSREDLLSDRVKWSDMTPPEYSAADLQAVEELIGTGVFRAYEKEYVRKDGVRAKLKCPVLARFKCPLLPGVT